MVNEEKDKLMGMVGEPMRSLIDEAWNIAHEIPSLVDVYTLDYKKTKLDAAYAGFGLEVI